MNNQEFLNCICQSFQKCLSTSSRSNEKLVILHGKIAEHLAEKLGNKYLIKALGYEDGKEFTIKGRYFAKKVDITVIKDDKPIAGIGVKFVMQNYSQNSVNYFENMLGETANIRSNGIPYFQIFIIPETLPYYKSGGKFKHWETFTQHNAKKYFTMSNDNTEHYFHTSTKTLLFVINLPEIKSEINDKKGYVEYYSQLKPFTITASTKDYGDFKSSVIFNNYEEYINEITRYIQNQYENII